uniref:Uncharacterized protein n=1 Tax=Raoultella ornithinolytica TaxID=54291 RepID=A0A0M5KM28_RAOOR|nr:hypothetical protein [Raoultella ornithinolytica]
MISKVDERDRKKHHFYKLLFWIDREYKKVVMRNYKGHQNDLKHHLMIDLIGRDL